MKNSWLRGLTVCSLVGTALSVLAESSEVPKIPKVPTASPYIVLYDNLDEPNGYGFCMDTYGPGKTDLVQTHSCKPTKTNQPRNYAGNDTRFYLDSSGRLASYAFEGLCVQALIAREVTVFALLECNEHSRQQFVYNVKNKTLHLKEDSERCLSVASKTVPAGPWVKRPLLLQTCSSVTKSLKQWSLVTEKL